jgi:hypothetical protein
MTQLPASQTRDVGWQTNDIPDVVINLRQERLCDDFGDLPPVLRSFKLTGSSWLETITGTAPVVDSEG